MPILGIIASQNYPRITSSYESIATVTVGVGGQSSLTFSSIPSTYKHLQLRISASTLTGSDIWLNCNNDLTSSNYSSHILWGNGSTVYASAFGTPSGSYLGYSGSTTSFVGAVVDILDYGSTNKNKTIRTLSGSDTNGGGQIYLASGMWINSSTAVNSIYIAPVSNLFNQYSKFALYGIRG